MVEVECLICNKKLEVFPSRAKRFKTCSVECMGKLNAGELNTICSYCKKEFHLKPFLKKRAKDNFCSVACHAAHKSVNERGANNHNFRNRQYDYDGYRIVDSPTYGRIAEHKAVIFEILSIDKIPEGFHIHHRDCNPLNNVSENLVLLSISDHRWLHAQFGNAGLFAYYYKKVSLDDLCSWSNDQGKARRLLDLNIVLQSVVLKSSELLGSPAEGDQQPS